ncbi:DNA-processing protein DprA [Marinomonas balearica]|uniref:DNA processing protein n=1 Tax=Marinomonas balearica TaxID=491947 RepID=A0A4R6M7V1_9GAMM|nr:DNA-processing protein DprA [Marinomonas balearica]TDO97404.1 DNA processing protein [Marinomonas balearica]
MDQTYLGFSLEKWLCLSFIEGVGPTRLARLYTYLKTLEMDQADTSLDVGTLNRLKWPKQTAIQAIALLNSNVLSDEAKKKRDVTQNWLHASRSHHIVFRENKAFPSLLHEIAVAPTFLYVQGNETLLQHKKCLGVVGARRASTFGRKASKDWSAKLASHDVCIVSGGAMGIDTYAHQGALDVQGKTLSVMGTGLLNLYPKQNATLYKNIVENDGALISEYPLTTEVRAHLFPPRNRIISGISSGVLVVEASERSGSLISAQYALEQNRNVYAVPGHINDVLASGPNALIRHGATLVRSAEDVLEDIELPLRSYPISDTNKKIYQEEKQTQYNTCSSVKLDKQAQTKLSKQTCLPDFLSVDAKTLFEILQQERVGLDFDELIRLTSWPAPNLMQTLMELELNSLIANQQGMYFRC